MALEFGLERLGFLTLTFADHVVDIREAQRRFNSLRTNVLARRYSASIAVVERQKSGRIHFHLLVVLDSDIRSGFDFDAIARHDYRSAGQVLRQEWAYWRQTAVKYGFGRTELLPVKSTSEGIAKYVGKYIAKHLDARKEEDRGARLVRYTRNARKCGTRFAWAGVRGWLWRAKVKQFAAGFGIASPEGMRHSFGSRWAYLLADIIAAETLTEYPTPDHARADGHDLPEDWVGKGKVTIRPARPAAPVVLEPGEVLLDDRPVVWPGSGAKGAPVRAKPVAPPASIWDGVSEAVRSGRICKPSPFVAIVPGGAALGVDCS
jgi:hypothetical protein